MFERSTDSEWQNQPGTFSDGRGDPLEQSCNSKTRTLRQQLAIIYCSLFRLYTVEEWERERERERQRQRQRERERERERSMYRLKETNTPARPNWAQTSDSSSNLQLTKFANFYTSKFGISLGWCHLTKLLWYLSCVLKCLLCFHLSNQNCDKTWIYFIFNWSSYVVWLLPDRGAQDEQFDLHCHSKISSKLTTN